ncbi:MAG: methylaspartate mutase subunit E, partial [Oscillospiraceae bacterium]
MDIQNKKWSDELFYKIREEEVMGQWPTGKEVDLKEAIDYQKAIPDHKSFTKKLNDAKAKGITLIQPRAGVALIDDHIKLLKYLQDNGEADLL